MTEKCGFLEVRAPRKNWRSESQSESKGPHCYGPCSHVPAGLPRGEVTERSEDQGEGKRPHRGRSVAEGTPLSATDRIEEEIPHVKPKLFLISAFICTS